MPSSRAREVAEVLWELKRADKVSTYSHIAHRAGFSAGSNGRAMVTTLRAVRRGWPHLQWWRAIRDDGLLEKGSEQEEKLRECGFEVEDADGKKNAVTIKEFDDHVMAWVADSDEDGEPQAAG